MRDNSIAHPSSFSMENELVKLSSATFCIQIYLLSTLNYKQLRYGSHNGDEVTPSCPAV
jgi:hypothetical protein